MSKPETALSVAPPRVDFSRIQSSLPIPNLIDVQRRSYERFLQMNLLPEERVGHGLHAVFTSIFPFSDFRETCSLDFVRYSLGDWQCRCGELKGLQYLQLLRLEDHDRPPARGDGPLRLLWLDRAEPGDPL